MVNASGSLEECQICFMPFTTPPALNTIIEYKENKMIEEFIQESYCNGHSWRCMLYPCKHARNCIYCIYDIKKITEKNNSSFTCPTCRVTIEHFDIIPDKYKEDYIFPVN